MPMINSDDLKHGLLPVQQAWARYKQTVADRKTDKRFDMTAQLEAEKSMHDAYVVALMGFHGYAQGMVNVAEGRAAAQDE
ncbi:hypothetical protein [Pseudomonas viridiflava]|uniref:hypothetical protein n=1 Tax=Pseudomonas viridiflava TaxID=33069 RepID=UPI000F01D497|nr:hypothetical protein [Pseudomonas viridiflava]